MFIPAATYAGWTHHPRPLPAFHAKDSGYGWTVQRRRGYIALIIQSTSPLRYVFTGFVQPARSELLSGFKQDIFWFLCRS